METNC